MVIHIEEHDNTFAGPGTAFRFTVDLNVEGEVIGTLETFLHTQGPKTVTFVERPPIWPVLDAWIMMLALAQHYGVGLIEVVDPDKRFPPERRPAPAGTHHIEVRG